MKRCPECNSFFPDAEHFCELDGAVLISVANAPDPHSKSSRTLLPIGVLAGVLLGVLLSLVYFAMSRQPTQENSNATSSSSSARQQEFLQPQQRTPLTTASPSPEPSAEPSPSPSIETPSPQNSPHVELSRSSPISTASGANGRSNPVVITLDSGVTIEADDAWQTGEGIWYRRGSIVTVIDPKEVKTIERLKPQSTPSSQPTASPQPSLQ